MKANNSKSMQSGLTPSADGRSRTYKGGLDNPLWVINTYNRLLTDVFSSLGLALPAALSLEDTPWLLTEGPALDKVLLSVCEGLGSIPSDVPVPEWLKPLWECALVEIREPTTYPIYLQGLRQVLLFGYKAEARPNDTQIAEAQASFEKTDSECADAAEHLFSAFAGPTWAGSKELRGILESARRLVGRVLANADLLDIVPSHGPGAVFPPSKPGMRSDFHLPNADLQQWYPFDSYFLSGLHSLSEKIGSEGITANDAGPAVAKLVAVPKDSRGPRLICVHPKELVWIQQGQRRVLEHAMDTHPMTRGRINFHDQSVNGAIALASSSSREYCTLDLKDASDRISCALVEILFSSENSTRTYDILAASRATWARLIDGRRIRLHKFAPMGNAITFPVEALVFWSVVRAGIQQSYGVICSDVYVFGDDILVPSAYAEGAIRALELVGLIVNKNKSFVKGFFRESCGVDAFKGFDVTPLRLKVSGVSTVTEAVSICDLAKRARLRGYSGLSADLYSSVSKRFGLLPKSNNVDSQGLFEYVDQDLGQLLCQEQAFRWNLKLHRWETQICELRAQTIKPRIHDWCHVLDSLVLQIHRGLLPSEGGTVYPIPRRDRLIRGWCEVKTS